MIDDHTFITSSESIASRITNRLAISPNEKVHQTLLIMIPSYLMKNNSGSCKFVLSQSSAKMNTLTSTCFRIYLLIMIFKKRREVWLLKFRVYLTTWSLLTHLSSRRMLPKKLRIIDKRDSSFGVEREKIIRSLFSSWENRLLLLFNFQMDKISARKLLSAIEMLFSMDWYKLYYSRYHPYIYCHHTSKRKRIHPYSTDFLSYIASFIIQRLFIAKTESGSSRY